MNEYIEKVKVMLQSAKIHYKYIEQVFEDSMASKKALNELLGLTEENHFRKKLSMTMNDQDFHEMYPFVLQVFKSIPGWQGTLKPTSGKITVGKDQVNITKFLSKALADNMVPVDYKKHLMIKLGINPENPKAESQLVPKFGELLNKKDSNVVVISTNPFDFFTSSAGDYKYASFRSCFRPGGEYFNGCNSLARDHFTTIAYKADSDKLDYKHGRAWMFILDKLVAQTKSYGTFTNTERKIAREYVEKQLAEKHGDVTFEEYRHYQVQKWKKKTNSTVLYFDDYSIDLGYPSSKYPGGFNDTVAPNISFSNARCLKCGRETAYPTMGICGKCSGIYSECYSCKKDLYCGREINAEGQRYCPDCAADKFEPCDHCGNYHQRGTSTIVRGSKICRRCITERFFFCDHCKEYHNKEDISHHTITDKNETWCAACYKKDAASCSDCGKKHSKEYVNSVKIKGAGNISVCNDCIKNYNSCAKCGVFFKGGFETCDGVVCQDCFTEYDFCVHCATFVPAGTIVSNGEAVFCDRCPDKIKGTDGSREKYLEEVTETIKDVQEVEIGKTGNAVAALQAMAEDRATNGFVEGDILRVVKDESYHQYPPGTLLVNCKKYVGIDNQVAYCTFRDNTEWFVRPVDVEFARPGLVPGDSFTYDKRLYVLDSVRVNENDSIIYVSGDSNFKAEHCTPIDVIDPKAFTALQYRVGEVVEITGNASKHPFKQGDKVKIMVADTRYGMKRYIVKKGTKYGCIWGSLADIVKSAAKEGTVKVKTPKVAK